MSAPPNNRLDRTKGARHAEIARRYARRSHSADQEKSRQLTHVRIAELKRLFEWRYGSELSSNWKFADDDAGRDDLRLVFEHIAWLPYRQERADSWVQRYAPWLSRTEQEEMIDDAFSHMQRHTAEAAGERLGLTYRERTHFGITTIFCVDKSRDEVTAIQKEAKRKRDRERQRQKREMARQERICRLTRRMDDLSPRAQVIYSVVSKGWQSVKRICSAVRERPEFEDLNKDSLKVAVHRAIKELSRASAVEIKREPLPTGLARLRIRRPPTPS